MEGSHQNCASPSSMHVANRNQCLSGASIALKVQHYLQPVLLFHRISTLFQMLGPILDEIFDRALWWHRLLNLLRNWLLNLLLYQGRWWYIQSLALFSPPPSSLQHYCCQEH